MIERVLSTQLQCLSALYPVVTVTGPRQSGKTTLCRAVFPKLDFVSLEAIDNREFAVHDPRGFLARYSRAVIDEAQHAPDLLSYIQVDVDEDATPGRFILTGSQHFGLSKAISQSLAGRAGVVHLLPPCFDELHRFDSPPVGLFDTLFAGSYPRIHDRRLPPSRWLGDYVTTYLTRDVRQLHAVNDLETFRTFLRLVAGRTATLVNYSDLGADAGVSHNTARGWLSVLEASFLVKRLPAWHRNVRQQMLKSPKVHMLDSGLACQLIGLRQPDQLFQHPLRGAVFESWVVSEVEKAFTNRGEIAPVYHYRDARKLEVDLVVEVDATTTVLIECKSGQTIAGDWVRPVRRVRDALASKDPRMTIESIVVYGGDDLQSRDGVRIIPWHMLASEPWLSTTSHHADTCERTNR